MEKTGVCRSVISQRTGIHVVTVTRFKSGETKITETYWELLAKVFGVTVDEFLRGPEGDREAPLRQAQGPQGQKSGRKWYEKPVPEKDSTSGCGVDKVLKILETGEGANGEYVDHRTVGV
jgi:transcriptional regulator with XRE-family HTH domain